MDLCNRNDIQALLQRHGFHFSKAMGQNFLIQGWVPRDIAAACGADEHTGVLEIGPGIGPLTRELAQRAGKVVSVELDRRLYPVLEETMADFPNFTLIRGDVMQQELPALVREHLGGLRPILCANLPYNITTPLLTRVVESRCFQSLTVLIQKEVAQRICAAPGTADYGAFTLLMQYYTAPELLFEVPNTCFLPAVDIKDTTKEELSKMMVGRDVQFAVEKKPCEPGKPILEVENLVVPSKVHKNNAVRGVSFNVRAGEIVCIAGIDGNGQSELIYGITGLEKPTGGTIRLEGRDITNAPIRERSKAGMSHIPEDRHKHGLVLDYTLADNMVLQRYWQPEFQNHGFIKKGAVLDYAERLIKQYDVRSGQGPATIARSMSGGNQQKAIIAREVDKEPELLVAVQPTRGLDVGAIEYIHKQIVAERDRGRAVLLVSLELDEVMNLSDRILVIYEGEIVGEFDPRKTTVEELGLYMAGAKKQGEAKA